MEITKDTIVQAWKSEEYRNSLPEDVQKAIPARPTGENGSDLSDAELEQAAGGTTPLAPLAALSAGEGAALGAAAGTAAIGGVIGGLSD